MPDCYVSSLAPVATGTGADTKLLAIEVGSTLPVEVLEWGVSFAGVIVTAAPIELKLVRLTTAPTLGVVRTPVCTNKQDYVVQAGGRELPTTGGTVGDVLGHMMIHPQNGVLYPVVSHRIIEEINGDIAILADAAAVTVNCIPYFIFRE